MLSDVANLAETQKIMADPRLLDSLKLMRQGNGMGLAELRTYLDEVDA